MIEVELEKLERVTNILNGVKNGANRALYNAIGRALSTVKTTANKAVRSTYNINVGNINKYAKITTKKVSSSNPVGSVSYAGHVIPLINFDVSNSKPVSVSVLREAGAKMLKDAYVTNLGKYGVGVFERETSFRESSKQLFGPSAAQMVENSAVITDVETKAGKVLNDRIEHEISRLLNGYGG